MKKSILFIGAGRLGTTLAWALSKNDFEIPFFYSKEYLGDMKKYLPDTILIEKLTKDNFQNVNIVLITVPDAQIENVVQHLDILDVNWKNKVVLHTSGCKSSIELQALKSKGAHIGSIHPMQTFDEYFLPITIFKNVIFSLEGDNQTIDFFEKIAELLDAKIINLKAEDKILYHIAAVASSNFFLALLDYVSELYSKLNFDNNKIEELILPIVNQTLNNFKKDESKNIITGPLKRGDLSTIENHVKYLNENQKDLLPVYNEISKYISQYILNQNESEKEKLNRVLNND